MSALYCMGFNEICTEARHSDLNVSRLRREFIHSYNTDGLTQRNHRDLKLLVALKDVPTSDAIRKSINTVDHGLFGNQHCLWAISYISPQSAIPVLIEEVRCGGAKGNSAHTCLMSISIRAYEYRFDAPDLTAKQWANWYQSEGENRSCFQLLHTRLHNRGIVVNGEDDRDGLIKAIQRFPLTWGYRQNPGFVSDSPPSEDLLIAMALSKHLSEMTGRFDISPAGFPMKSPDLSWINVGEGQRRKWSKWQVILGGEAEAMERQATRVP